MNIGDWFRRPTLAARLDLIVQQNQQVNFKLQALERMEKAMSQLTDAVAALTAANAAEHQELQLVLNTVSAFPAQLQAAIDQALASGASKEDLAAIQAVTDQQAADTAAMSAALAAPASGTGTTGSDTSAGTGAGGTAPATGGDANPPAGTGSDNSNVA